LDWRGIVTTYIGGPKVHGFSDHAPEDDRLARHLPDRHHRHRGQKVRFEPLPLPSDVLAPNRYRPAEILGLSDTTVIEVRKKLESTSQSGKLKKLLGKDGKRLFPVDHSGKE